MAVEKVANNPLGSYPVLVDRNTAGSDIQVMRLDMGIGTAEDRVTSANPLPTSITGSIPLPTDAATATNQTTEITRLTEIRDLWQPDNFIQNANVSTTGFYSSGLGQWLAWDGSVDARQSGTWTVSTTSAISGIGDGRTTVTTAGTRVVLAASTACKKVDIQALASNTDVIVVGGTSVVAAIGTRQGIALNPGDVYTIEIDNLNDINIDSVVSGEKVSYTYYT